MPGTHLHDEDAPSNEKGDGSEGEREEGPAVSPSEDPKGEHCLEHLREQGRPGSCFKYGERLKAAVPACMRAASYRWPYIEDE